MVIAEPQYVALCGSDEQCASTSVAPDGTPAGDPTVAVVPLDAETGSVTLRNNNAVGTTVVSVLGYFDSEAPGADAGAFESSVADIDLRVSLGNKQARTVTLPNVPESARAVLVQLGGTLTAVSDSSSSRATAACTDGSTGKDCRVASIALNSTKAPLTKAQVKQAIEKIATATSTPTPHLEETVQQVVENVADAEQAPTPVPPRPQAQAQAQRDDLSPNSTHSTTSVPSAEPAPAPEAPAPAPAKPKPAPSYGSGPGGPTGVPAGTALQVIWGDQVITQAGTVIDGKDIHGRVIVKAPNVTIKNSIIRGPDSGLKYGIVDAMAGQPGLRIVDTEIAATDRNPWVNGIMGYNFELHRVNIHHVIDQVHITGDNVVVADSWLHDNLHYEDDPNHSDGSHDDNVQIQVGQNITIVGNVMSHSHNANIQVTQDRGKVGNLRIANNRFDHGGCSVNIAEKSHGALSAVSILDNVFGRTTKWANCAVIIASDGTRPAYSGNTYADGAVPQISYR
ncbi:MAG: Parallel beta-helix repeat protein [Naasia sp.]|nr:Parallel beta-helix repeat protein [Naasia sp.]